MLGNIVVCEREDLEAIIQQAVAKAIGVASPKQAETDTDEVLIDRVELVRRLATTPATIIKWERKKKIPCYHLGSSVRYQWSEVKKALLYKA